jgi:hypothetical protein
MCEMRESITEPFAAIGGILSVKQVAGILSRRFKSVREQLGKKFFH